MRTLIVYEVGKRLWQVFAKADSLVNKLDAHGVEGCRFELFDDGTGQELHVNVPAESYAAAYLVMES